MPVDLGKSTKHLRTNALPKYGKGRCGEYVRIALQAGGADFGGANPRTGKEYGPTLERLGFHEITVDHPDTFKLNPRRIDHHVHLPRQGWELLRELHPHWRQPLPVSRTGMTIPVRPATGPSSPR